MDNEGTGVPESVASSVPSDGDVAASAGNVSSRGTANKYPQEVHDRAVHLVFESRDEYDSEWAAIKSIAYNFGCSPETLRGWVRQVERDSGQRVWLISGQQEGPSAPSVQMAESASVDPLAADTTPDPESGNEARAGVGTRISFLPSDLTEWKPFLIAAGILILIGATFALGSVAGGLLLG